MKAWEFFDSNQPPLQTHAITKQQHLCFIVLLIMTLIHVENIILAIRRGSLHDRVASKVNIGQGFGQEFILNWKFANQVVVG